MGRLSHIASLFSLASVGFAALPIPDVIPFTVTGGLDSCTPDGSGYNSGGSIAVNNFNIKVPKNLIVQFPVVYAPFSELCGAGAGGFETTVNGNIVNGQAIAAQIQVSARFGLEGSQGYIETVNIADGSLKIKGGPTVRINDPDGVFAKKTTSAPFFPSDGENPSITAFSGFPMCIPRDANDEKCPSSNRPSGTTNFEAPDPLRMVPFKEGDFIEYSGLKVGDNEILAYAITAINVQVTTKASNTVPNYIRVEDLLIGVPDTNANVEVADIRLVGFLSSCAGATIFISAIEVDPCTGEEKLRQVGSGTPRAGDVRCKFDIRLDTNGKAPYTRDYLITVNTPVVETKDGIKGSQYVQAVGEWILPEVDVPGAEPPPYQFTSIRGLVEGDYLDGKQYGQLSPFPGTNPPAPSQSCTSNPNPDPNQPGTGQDPVASIAAISATQRVGAQILLAGSNTASGISNSDLVFAWTKTSPASPSISVQNAAQPTATFTAPKVTADTSFVFELQVSLKSDTTKSSKANVTVKVSANADDIVTLDAYTWESRQSGTISVSCHSNVVNGDNKKMSLLLNNGASTLGMVNSGSPGVWSYSARSTKKPTNVQCVSDLKGKSALVTSTTSKRRRRRGELGLDSELVSRAEWV